jgi:F-type H+-transporting ATPase subunit c
MRRVRKALIAALVGGAAMWGGPGVALAAEGGGGEGMSFGLVALAAGLAVGLPTFGAALGQGRATAAAMESIGRNPNSADRIFTPMIIGLALMEALGLYGLVIAFMLQGKVG